MQLVLDRLKPLLEDPAVLKIGHNLKYDWVMFDKAGHRRRAGRRHDGDELRPRRRAELRPRARRARQARTSSTSACPSSQLCGTGEKQITFDKVPLGPATEYAAEDADITCGCGFGSSRGWRAENVDARL